jgi:hypothetical protein
MSGRSTRCGRPRLWVRISAVRGAQLQDHVRAMTESTFGSMTPQVWGTFCRSCKDRKLFSVHGPRAWRLPYDRASGCEVGRQPCFLCQDYMAAKAEKQYEKSKRGEIVTDGQATRKR